MKRSSEAGFAMLLVFLMAAVVAISLYMEIPRVAFQSQRQKEQLLMERGEQYQRAIQLFVRTTGHYPAKLDDLENFNNRRFLRHKFKDPITGKQDWRLIHINAAGVFADSLLNKPKQGDKDQSISTQGSVGVMAGLGEQLPGSEQQQQVATAESRRRASEGGAAQPLLGPDGQPINPQANAFPGAQGTPGAPPGFPGNLANPNLQPNQPGFNPGAQFNGALPGNPNFAVPGQAENNGAQPGGISGQPNYVGTPNNGVSGQPNYVGTPNTNLPGQQGNVGGVNPGQPFPNQQPPVAPQGINFANPSNFPPTIQARTGQSQFGGIGNTGGGGSSLGDNSSVGGISSSIGGASSVGGAAPVMPYLPPPPVQNNFPEPGGIPLTSMQPTPVPGFPNANVPNPNAGLGGANFNAPPTPFNQPANTPGGAAPSNAGTDMIRNLLTTPRVQPVAGSTPGGTPVGQTVGAGIAGVASLSEDPAIMVYKDRKKYNEWEFIFDAKAQTTVPIANAGVNGTPVQNLASGQGGVAPGGGPGGINPAAGFAGAASFGNPASPGGVSGFGGTAPLGAAPGAPGGFGGGLGSSPASSPFGSTNIGGTANGANPNGTAPGGPAGAGAPPLPANLRLGAP